MIRQAPRTIIGSILLISAVAGLAEYEIFKETLNIKNDLIGTLRKQVAAKSVPQTSSSAGSVSTSAPNSPANTGNGNTYSYGQPSAPKLEKAK